MKNFKKVVSAFLIASTLSISASTPPAKAGIILAPAGVGVVLLIVGVIYHNKLMIILDADGNLSQSSLEKGLDAKYSFIDDQDVVRNLASSIREKAASAVEVDGKKLVRLSREEVLDILQPTGLADLQPEAVEGLIRDLE